MNMMRNICALVAFLSVSAAQAMVIPGQEWTAYFCKDPREIIDAGVQVRLVEVSGGGYRADLNETTIAGLKSLGSPVVQVTSPHDSDAPTTYTADNFKLEIFTSQGLSNDGFYKAYLTSTLGGFKISQDMKCERFFHIF